MPNHSGTHHVQIDVPKTSKQMAVILDHRGVVSVGPECAGTLLFKIEALCELPMASLNKCAQVHHGIREDEKMYVITCNAVAQKSAFGGREKFPEFRAVFVSICSVVQQGSLVVTSVRDVHDLAIQDVSIRPGHGFNLHRARIA